MTSKSSIFREYDIRGIFDKELDQDMVTKIGYGLSSKFDGEFVAIGYDARSHSPQLFEWLSAGFNAGGKRVLNMGIVPTPANYFCNYQSISKLTEGEIDSDSMVSASVMITGSHNPPEYNGFKITVEKAPFFGEQIYSMGRDIMQMGDIVEVDTNIIEIDANSQYIEYMVENFSHLKGMDTKIVYDCGNGVAGVVLPQIFKALEFDTKGIYIDPDGTFPNHHPDPSEEKNLADIKELLYDGADIAFAYDGDADRIAVLTQKYNIKGDQMALLYSLVMDNPTVIGEVKCSQVMYDELAKRGAKGIMYKTGHSNLKVKMRETDADLACEVSGHIFFKHRYFGYDDAIYATLRMLELIYKGIDLDRELDSLPVVYSTEEIKVYTTEEDKFIIIDKIKELLKSPPSSFPKIVDIIDIDGVRINFESGWGLVRASNTTPVLVTRFESTDSQIVKVYEDEMMRLIESAKNAI
jgi:phosphomannomutase/phosphoglucomutase